MFMNGTGNQKHKRNFSQKPGDIREAYNNLSNDGEADRPSYSYQDYCSGLTLASNPAPCNCLLTPLQAAGLGGESERNVKLRG